MIVYNNDAQNILGLAFAFKVLLQSMRDGTSQGLAWAGLCLLLCAYHLGTFLCLRC
jgi:hypothetical protein